MTDQPPHHGAFGPSHSVAEAAGVGTTVVPAGGGTGGFECRILVVEDDQPVRDSCVRLLQQAGCDVTAAEDGEAGWAALQQGRFQVVVSDHRMPRLTGVDMIRRMRAAGLTLPVILASGTLPWDANDIPADLHPVTLLPKPYGREALLLSLRGVLGGATRQGGP